jgi:hypothetical protein
VLVIVHSDNGPMMSLENATCVTLPVLVVPVQTTTIAVVVLNQDSYKITTVLIHVLNKEPTQITLPEPVLTVTILVKNVLDHKMMNVLSVITTTGYSRLLTCLLIKVCVLLHVSNGSKNKISVTMVMLMVIVLLVTKPVELVLKVVTTNVLLVDQNKTDSYSKDIVS